MTTSATGSGDWLAVVLGLLGLLGADAPSRVLGAPEDWPRWAVLVPHVLTATGHFEPLPGLREQPGRPETSWLPDRAATYLQVHARLGEALPLAEQALAIAEAAYGPDHPDVGTDLNNLAVIWKDLGQPERARPLAERAPAITTEDVPSVSQVEIVLLLDGRTSARRLALRANSPARRQVLLSMSAANCCQLSRRKRSPIAIGAQIYPSGSGRMPLMPLGPSKRLRQGTGRKAMRVVVSPWQCRELGF